MFSRRSQIGRRFMIECLSMALLSASSRGANAQVESGEWHAWAFGRAGAAVASKADLPNQPLPSVGAGVAVSYGALLGMVRATDIEPGSFEDNAGTGNTDYAVLAGVRSRGERLYLGVAAGISQSRQQLTLNSNQLVPAFDLSAHADSRFAGVALTVSGVFGPSSAQYAAISLGVEFGKLGFR